MTDEKWMAMLSPWIAAAHPRGLGGHSALAIGPFAHAHADCLARLGASPTAAIVEPGDRDTEANVIVDSVYDLWTLPQPFDLVLLAGGTHRLRHLLFALDLIHCHATRDTFIAQVTTHGDDGQLAVHRDYPFSETAVFTEAGFPAMAISDGGGWLPNRACARAMLRASGFAITAELPDDVFVCRRLPVITPCDDALSHFGGDPGRDRSDS